MSTRTPTWTRSRRRVVIVAGLVLALALVLVGALQLLGGTASDDAPAPSADATVLVKQVSFTPTDTAYVVESTQAVVHGDAAFLRLRLLWVDDPDDSGGERRVPAFSATVLHREPYAGVTATCGLPEPTTVAADAAPQTLDLPCSGLLVPDSVASVELRD